jgi:hypothetical protein
MASSGGSPSHRYEVNGALEGYFWACSCGTSTSPVYKTENDAVASAERHVTDTPPVPR